MGTIVDIHEETRDFEGDGIKTKLTDVVSKFRVRLLDISTGAIRFSEPIKGAKKFQKTSSSGHDNDDRPFASVEDAVMKLADDAKFTEALFGRNAADGKLPSAKGLVIVEFAPKPDNCDVVIAGKYVGGSPLTRRLPTGKDVKVRIAKTGFVEWEGTIVPEKGLKISREFEPKP